MIPGLDTSVIVRLLIGEPEADARTAQRLLAAQPVFVSDLAISETYFALRHHYKVPHARCIAALRAFLDDPRVNATGVAREVMQSTDGSQTNPGFMDRLIHSDYAQQGATVFTFDRSAAKLEGARLLE